MKPSQALFWIVLALTLALGGCYAHNYSVSMRTVQQAVQSGDLEQAKQSIEKIPALKKTRNALLYDLELGVLDHLNGDYAESNQRLEQAVALMEAQDAVRLSGLAAEWIFSERFHPYWGEDYERVLAHYYMALNYLMMERLPEALVECRRCNTLLQRFNDRYEQKSVYKSDAFMLYLSGLIYDAMGELNDALIDYRHAFEIYSSDYAEYYATPLPLQLPEQLLRTSAGLGFAEEFQDYQQQFPEIRWNTQEEFRKSARLIVIWNKGFIPAKVQSVFRWRIGGDGLKQPGCVIRFAFPELRPRVERLAQAVVRVNGHNWNLELAEELADIARKNLEDRRLRSIMQASSRNIISCTAEQALEDVHWIWGWIFAGAAELSQGADLRHWSLLPAEIQITQLLLPPGKADLELCFKDHNGRLVQQARYHKLDLQAGKSRFLIHRTF
ncbi:hypothetical protein CSB45_03480 [candidate division KSB3 bacterium]|uniref:Tetratricopeptide repeat protein n=1 Tax=candidate division KSB3 bacterium TaxID=2044937 RepID=A0A2G6EA21_9BACT|nr:MAG: hypothetical protein CSB45_03480 [candidate division KSB3 bacterium]PIE29556.1 MAG: hypothetical protein CSA57_08075 [candidate division KSB3 bacterium]